jgi:hypothetical protein
MTAESRNSKLEPGSLAVEEQSAIGNRRSNITVPFLLEVGCEEIPARFLRDAEKSLGERVRAALSEARLLPEAGVGGVRDPSPACGPPSAEATGGGPKPFGGRRPEGFGPQDEPPLPGESNSC